MPTNYKNESVERLTRIALLVTAALLVLLLALTVVFFVIQFSWGAAISAARFAITVNCWTDSFRR